MKRKILLSIALLIGLLIVIRVFNPPQKEELNGIFALRLGMSEKELRKVIDINLLKEKGEKEILEDKLFERYSDSYEVVKRRVKVFLLDYYALTDSYELENISFYFFDDKFFHIIITEYNVHTEDLLTQKYGDPEEEETIFVVMKDTTTYLKKKWKNDVNKTICRSWATIKSGNTISDYELKFNDTKLEWSMYPEIADDIKKKEKEEKAQQKKEVQTLLDKL